MTIKSNFLLEVDKSYMMTNWNIGQIEIEVTYTGKTPEAYWFYLTSIPGAIVKIDNSTIDSMIFTLVE